MLPDVIFPAVVESLPDAVVIASRAGTIEFLNSQTEALFGYERKELLGQPVEILVPYEYRQTHGSHRGKYTRNPGIRPMGVGIELWGQRKDGSQFPVEISLSPLVRGTQMYITSVIRDLTERQQMRSEIEADRDRQRIAMDLHDGTIQNIYAIGLGLELALGELVQDPVDAGRRIDTSIEQLNQVVADIRAYIFDLRAGRYSGNLLQDLASTVEEFSAGAGIAIDRDFQATAEGLREDRAGALLQIVRESLSNIRKHAAASRVAVRLSDDRGMLTLEVQDDGSGFDAAIALPETHRGLRNMKLRTQRLGGVFDVETSPGAGTLLRVRMPVG